MPDKTDPPKLKVVSEKSAEELAKQQALDELHWPMRELTANLLRVARGAGKAYEIPNQIVTVLECLKEYQSEVGYLPSDHELSAALRLHDDADEARDGFSFATHVMVKGALQMAASTLVGQSTQHAAGRSELMRGLKYLEDHREENRKRYRGTAKERAEIAEKDKLREDLARRAAELSNPKKKEPPHFGGG